MSQSSNRENSHANTLQKHKFKTLNKNSTARILLSRAKVGKMGKFPRPQIKPFAPSFPKASLRQKNKYPELPSLTHRSNSGALNVPQDRNISKEARTLKQILRRPPSQAQL